MGPSCCLAPSGIFSMNPIERTAQVMGGSVRYGMPLVACELRSHEDKSLPSYRILRNDLGDTRVVKVGFSWPAFFLNVLWAVANGLWVVAFLILVLAVCGLVLFSSAVQSSPILVSLGAIFAEAAFLIFLGSRANDWLTSHLEGCGYVISTVVSAPSVPRALEIASTESHAA